MRNADYKAVLSISIPPDQRQSFYSSLAQFRQRFPFTTKSGLVVQAVIAASQMEQLVIDALAPLSQPVQITQHGPIYLWCCATGQGSAHSLLEAIKQTLTTLLGSMPAAAEDQPVLPGGTKPQLPSQPSTDTAYRVTFRHSGACLSVERKEQSA